MEIASIIFLMMFFGAIAAWAAAEWMVVKEVVRVCRDAGRRRLAKIRSIAMVVAEIPLACLFLFVNFILSTIFAPPNGYCLHLWVDGRDLARIVLFLALAPVFGLTFGFICIAGVFAFLDKLGTVLFGDCGNDMSMALCDFPSFVVFALFVLSGVYSLVWAFMRGTIMWGAPGHSKWRPAFVFWVTYWPQVLLILLLGIAENSANARGCSCWFLR